ncbi:MAG: CPBP family intramembrane metalloprotease [Phycisphaerae bacterium]|nr:CPBP family intramembrane metalloprotease [Phycisphaerae bacterium]
MAESIPLLDGLDLVLMGMGVVVLSIAAARWLRQGRPDLLLGAPVRTHVLGPLTVWLCLAVYLLGMALGVPFAWLLPASMPDLERLACAGVIASVAGQIILIATCLAVARGTFAGGLRGFGLAGTRLDRDLRWSVAGWLVALCLTGVAVWYSSWVIITFWPAFTPPSHPVFEFLESRGSPPAIRFLAFFGAATLAPIGEEVLFRGILQTGLAALIGWGRPSSRARWGAILVTAVLFGMMHTGTPHFVPALMLLGVLLGYTYERTGSLWVPIGLHMLFNIKSLLWYCLQVYLMG